MCMTWNEMKSKHNEITLPSLKTNCALCTWEKFCDKNMVKHCKKDELIKINLK